MSEIFVSLVQSRQRKENREETALVDTPGPLHSYGSKNIWTPCEQQTTFKFTHVHRVKAGHTLLRF